MFQFSETTHAGWEAMDGLGIRTQTTVRFATPGEVTEAELIAWLKEASKFDGDFWTVQMEGGEWEIESLDECFDGFVSEVMSTLNEYGVSIADNPVYSLAE